MTNPYRGYMPAADQIAVLVAGHRVQADSPAELPGKLRRLGSAQGFKVDNRGDTFTLTFASGDPVIVEGVDPCQPN